MADANERDGERLRSFISAVALDGTLATAELRRLAVEALSRTDTANDRQEGGGNFNYLPTDVAADVVERIDGGEPAHDMVDWLAGQLQKPPPRS